MCSCDRNFLFSMLRTPTVVASENTGRHEKKQREVHQTKGSSDSMKTRCSNTVIKGGSETLKVRRNPTTRNPGLEEKIRVDPKRVEVRGEEQRGKE